MLLPLNEKFQEQGVGDSHSNKVWKLGAGGLSERANRALCVWNGA